MQILKGEFEKAVDLIMAYRDSDKSQVTEAKALWVDKRDAKGVLQKLPKSFNIERRLMQGVVQKGVNKLSAALCNVPR